MFLNMLLTLDCIYLSATNILQRVVLLPGWKIYFGMTVLLANRFGIVFKMKLNMSK